MLMFLIESLNHEDPKYKDCIYLGLNLLELIFEILQKLDRNLHMFLREVR